MKIEVRIIFWVFLAKVKVTTDHKSESVSEQKLKLGMSYQKGSWCVGRQMKTMIWIVFSVTQTKVKVTIKKWFLNHNCSQERKKETLCVGSKIISRGTLGLTWTTNSISEITTIENTVS